MSARRNKTTEDYRQSEIYRRRWYTLAVLALSLLIISIDNTIVNVALPTLRTELKTTWSELQWIVDAYALSFAALLITMGSLGDRLGRAHLLRTGIILFGAASLGGAFCDSAAQLTAARAAMGIGASMIMPATLAIITNVFPQEERGKALGAWGAIVGASIALGPTLGGFLLEYFNWGSIFLINIPIVIVALITGHFFVPNSRDPHPQQPDIPGTVLSGATLAIIVFGLIKGGEWGWDNPGVIGTLIGGVACAAIFVIWERRTDHPMMNMWLFRNPRFSAGIGCTAMLMMCQMGVIFGLTQYMQAVLGYSPFATGIRFLPFALGIAVGANLSPRLAARFGTNKVLCGGFLGFAAIMAAASQWETDTSFLVLGFMFVAFSFAMGHVMPPSAEAILGAVPLSRAGVGSATNSAAVQVGGAIGVAALGSVLSTVYSDNVKTAIENIPNLPEDLAGIARDNVGGAIEVASRLPDGAGEALAIAARESFMDGWQMVAFVTCGLAVLAALFALRFMPPRHLSAQDIEAP